MLEEHKANHEVEEMLQTKLRPASEPAVCLGYNAIYLFFAVVALRRIRTCHFITLTNRNLT